MKLKLLTIFEFDDFAKNHPLKSYYQSSKYAMLMAEKGFDYDLIGYVDEKNNIKAASLIAYKRIGSYHKYGYAPKGFLLDYYDPALLKDFTEAIKKYYKRKGFVFIKINPEIPIGELDINTKYVMYNNNLTISDRLESLGYKKLGNNMLFESLIPRFGAIIPLKKYSFSNLAKQTRNKIRKCYKKGMTIKKGTREDIDILFYFIKRKKDKSLTYYKNYYNIFSKDDSLDIFLIRMNFQEALIYAREQYDKEEEKNSKYNEELMLNPSDENMKLKMESDKRLLTYKEDIISITKELANNKTKYIAGAITVKYENEVNIIISGYDKKYKRFSPNYFLHYKLLEYYKDKYDYIDLNGITGDFSIDNPYQGLNDFKLGFNPKAYEYIGEFDLILKKKAYTSLDKKGILIKEFNRKQKA